jgi:hypothetical protein
MSDPSIIRLSTKFSTPFSWFAKKIMLEQFPELEDEAQHLYSMAAEMLEPQSIHAQKFIDSFSRDAQGVSSVTIEGCTFTGKVLDRLEQVHRVFPYIATCGTGLEEMDVSSMDFLAPYWIEILKTQALREAQRQLRAYLSETYRITRTNSLNPGSGNVDIWPIEGLREVFTLLEGGDEVGVRLTESCLMIPNKSISGLFFDQDRIYESCAYCSREHCPDRRVPFKEQL